MILRTSTLLTLATLATLGACAGSIPRPTDQHAAVAAERWPGTTRADLDRGRDLYVNRCSSCHALIEPQRFGPEKWEEMVGEMAHRAKLRDEDKVKVLHYLVSFAR